MKIMIVMSVSYLGKKLKSSLSWRWLPSSIYQLSKLGADEDLDLIKCRYKKIEMIGQTLKGLEEYETINHNFATEVLEIETRDNGEDTMFKFNIWLKISRTAEEHDFTDQDDTMYQHNKSAEIHT